MSKLRAVTPGERAFKKMSVVEAAEQGTHQDLLRALRDRLAAAIEDPAAHPRDIANLARQLGAVSESLQVAAVAAAEGDPIGVAAATPDEPWSAV